ncbi:DUF1275 domain-containing protein [Cruoricaptor ignavus]|uniref:DUF1275 domain-containing protein n=1 Tax=Cruoricaptor ignavus TaxID=1118202 RepID=A0A7M1T2J0_9FLAO|nr:DUF1275 family protein [Cruoricaptor ignavus]QOR74076.1 DUF1275 domain-containing protein [Cruoricaptor ignavus]
MNNNLKSALLNSVGGGIDAIGYIALFGFFTAHVTGNLVVAGASWVEGDPGLWIKLLAIPVFIFTVFLCKLIIDRGAKVLQPNVLLSSIFLLEALLLSLFMLAGLYFTPFEGAGAGDLAATAFLGLAALAVRNTSGKTLLKDVAPSTVMTGNATSLGMELAEFFSTGKEKDRKELLKSFINVLTFVLGAFVGTLLYVKLGFWSVAFFVFIDLVLAYFAYQYQICPKPSGEGS